MISCVSSYMQMKTICEIIFLSCAATLARVPDVPDEMSDLTLVRNNVNTILNQLHSLTECVSSIKLVISEINEVPIQTRNLLCIPPAAPAVIHRNLLMTTVPHMMHIRMKICHLTSIARVMYTVSLLLLNL